MGLESEPARGDPAEVQRLKSQASKKIDLNKD